MNIAGKPVKLEEEEADDYSCEKNVDPASPTQIFTHQSFSPIRYRISALFSLLVLPTARAAAETAPAEGWDDFANNLGSDLAPLLALFGEQVTIQYLSEALSLLDCLLFALAPLGIITAMVSAIRVGGSPLFRSLVGRAKESRGSVEADLMSSTSEDVCELWNGEGVVRVLGRPVLLQLVCFDGDQVTGDGSRGVYTFRDAVKRGLYHAKRDGNSTDVELSTLSGAHLDAEDLRALEKPPNLSLNVSVRPLDRRVLVAFVCFGMILQTGVLAYAAVVQYKLEFEKNDKAPVAYGLYVFVVGTISLAAGIFGCAMIVERSTSELKWVPVRKESSKSVIWLQQGGQTVGDQRFESFARIVHGKENAILSSHKSAKPAVGIEDHWDEETDINREPIPATETFGTSVLVTIAVATAFIGFIVQFLGLRVMHSSVTIAQLGAILIMTALRSCAYIQRENRNDIKNPDQVEGHELDWLAENFTGCHSWQVCQEWQVIGSLGESDGEHVEASEVMKTRARLARLSGDWKLDIRVTADALQVVVEATINDVFAKMTVAPEVEGIFEWNIPVKTRLGRDAGKLENITLILKRSKDENSNWRPWEIEKSELEAVLSLWVFSITKLGRIRERRGLPRLKRVWLLDMATEEAMIDYRLWIHRGTTPKSTLLDPETLYFGWIGTKGVGSSSVTTSNPQEYQSVEREGPLVSVCAQSLYSSFLFNLACKVTDVGGITARRTEEPTAGGSGADHWSKFRLNNSNLASLAVIYNETLLGTVEAAYFSIIPAFYAANRLPYPHEAYKEARAASATLSQGKQWEKAIEIDLWLYSNSKKTNFSPSDAAVMAAEIISRLRALIKELPTRCIAMGEMTDEKLRRLWDAARKLVHLIAESPVDQTACAIDLFISHHIVKPTTGIDALYQLVVNNLWSFRQKIPEKSEMLFKLLSLGKGPFFSDEIEKYLLDPALLQLAAQATLYTEYDAHQRTMIPRELTLIHEFRTPLQFASEIGHAVIVQQLLTAGAAIQAEPGKFYGRTALQAAAGAGHKDIVELLLLMQAEVNAKPGRCHGRTALQAAAGAGYMDIVELLLSMEAEVNAGPGHSNGRTALQAAAGAGHKDIVELLSMQTDVNAGPGDDHGRTALQAAAGAGHKDIVELLLSRQAEVNAGPGHSNGRTALQAAAGAGHMDIVELLSMQADVNAGPGDDHGRTALQAAAGAGYMDIVELLLSMEAEVNAKPGHSNGRTALQAAAGAGHKDIVELLLSRQAKVNANPGDSNGRTALQAAAGAGHKDIVELLLSRQAEVNANPGDSNGRTALQAAAGAGHKDIVELLLSMQAEVNAEPGNDHGRTALQAAAGAGRKDIVELLISRQAEVNAGPGLHNGRTALQAAAGAGRKDIVELLISRQAEVNAGPGWYNGRTALQAAAGAGHKDIVELLLSRQAEVNAKPGQYNGRTALQAAAGAKRKDIVELLLARQAEVNAEPGDDHGRTALQAAAESGNLAVVDRFLEKGADVNAPSSEYGKTALQAAAAGGHMSVVDRLLEKGANVNAPPPHYGETALQAAAAGGHMSVVDRLLEKGADVNAEPASSGKTALQAAAAGGHMSVVDRLLEKGANVNAPPPHYGETALQAAAAGGHMSVVDRLLEKGADVNAGPGDDHGRTALQAAAAGGHMSVVDRLLEKGANVNAPPPHHGKTALQAAAAGGHMSVVDRLLEKGADINARGSWSSGAALKTAAAGGHMSVVDRLLEKGADVNAKSSAYGGTALQAAAAGKHMSVVDRLRKAGAVE